MPNTRRVPSTNQRGVSLLFEDSVTEHMQSLKIFETRTPNLLYSQTITGFSKISK
jgi:hypothetical protein